MWLMEVRHHPTDHTIAVRGGDDNAGWEDQRRLLMAVQVVEERLQGFLGRQLRRTLVRLPLGDVQGLKWGLGIILEISSQVIETL